MGMGRPLGVAHGAKNMESQEARGGVKHAAAGVPSDNAHVTPETGTATTVDSCASDSASPTGFVFSCLTRV